MKKLLLIKIFLIFIIGEIYSQDTYIPGFIILNSNDTIYGMIKDEKDIYSGMFCVFKENSNSKIVQYLPTEIKSYYLNNNRYFVSKSVVEGNTEKTVFLQFLIEGELNIYRHKDIKRNKHFFAENSKGYITELIPSFEKTVLIDNKTYIQTIKPFIGVLKFLTIDEPIISEKIDDISGILERNLIELAKDYHVAVCDENNCKIYFYDY